MNGWIIIKKVASAFIGLIRRVGQGIARYYDWQMAHMVEPYDAQIDRVLRRSRELVGGQGLEPKGLRPEGELRQGGPIVHR